MLIHHRHRVMVHGIVLITAPFVIGILKNKNEVYVCTSSISTFVYGNSEKYFRELVETYFRAIVSWYELLILDHC
jgi:hypothetical protein